MYSKLNEFEMNVVSEIKLNFNLKADKNVGKIACFIICYDVERKLTNNRIADLIVLMKSEMGLLCECSGSCIAWYRNKLIKGKIKKVETIEERKEKLKKELESLESKLKERDEERKKKEEEEEKERDEERKKKEEEKERLEKLKIIESKVK